MKRAMMVIALVAARAWAPAAAAPSDPADPAPSPATGPAGDPADARCQAGLAAHGRSVSVDACRGLAVVVVDALYVQARPSLQRTLALGAGQPRITDTPGAQTSSGQTAAVASGQPVRWGGGSVAVGDTGHGLELVTALAINPASIAVGETSMRSVWASRLVDVSLILPLDVKSTDMANHGFQYIGGRFRLNTLAAFQAEALTQAVAAYQALKGPTSADLVDITALLRRSDDPGKCATAIINGNRMDQVTFCGQVVDSSLLDKAFADAHARLAEFREDTDRKYLSIEGRFDRGDLNQDGSAANDSLVAAYLSGGYGGNAVADGTTLEFRGRGGFVWFHDGATDRSRSAVYGAFGAELAVVRDLKRYCVSAALEVTKQWGDGTMAATVNPGALRLGLGVPLADGRVVSVGVVLPTSGGESTIALSGDWSLLLGQ